MAKLTLQARGFATLALLGAVAVACGSSDDGANGDGDGDGDGDNGTSTGGMVVVTTGGGPATGGAGTGAAATGGAATGGDTSTGGSTASACDGLAVIGGENPLIDEFENPDSEAMGPRESSSIPDRDNRTGSWFVANDGTLGATQTPAAQMEFPTEGVGVDGSDGFATSASGFSDEWGANFGVTLNDNGGNGCAYDASAFDGISFCAISGDGGSHILDVGVPIPAIIPTDRGGTCVGEGCDDTHFTTVVIGATWECHEIMWGDLAQTAGWNHDNKYDFDSSNIAQITWKSSSGEYDVVIDDVRFLGEGTGMGGASGN